MDYESADSLEKPEELEKNPTGVVRRWILELKLADKRESDWKKKAEKVWERYRQKQAKRNSFNILWSNTETLRPAVYNSLPKPDVRRRFKDEDPLGKAVSQVLSRSLEYGLDTTDFNHSIENSVLDMLLPGRGVCRVRYVPSLQQVGVTAETHEEDNEQHDEAGEALEGTAEEVEWEQAPIEHVQWDDFKHGSGKTWDEVCWIGFRHRLTRDELEEQFGDIGSRVKLDSADDEEIQKERDAKVADAFRTAEVWEIWDKDEQRVVFVAPSHRDEPLKTIADPLNLQGFFPIPRPLLAIEDSASLIPTPLYELYREQAEELDRISSRINRIIDGLRMRGIYDSTLSELSELMKGQDNDFTPAQNVTAYLERGGLKNAIWTTQELVLAGAQVLKILYEQREATKQVIYEITGIADIIRGASVASETATAQQIKDKWGSMRLRKLQAEVARFIRDLMRLQAEIIGEKFQPETLMTMTGLKFPTMAEKQQDMMKWQKQAMMAQQQGQQPPPQPDIPPAWEEIIQVMRDDKQRTYKIDVETDSTVAASIEGDMQAMQQLLSGVVQLVQGFGPAVQLGAIPIEAVKEMILSVVRRAKMGNAVEDALEKMQAPKPQADPGQAQAQAAQAKAQADAQAKQQQMQQDMQLEQMRMQMEDQHRQRELQAEMQLQTMREQLVAEREQRQAEQDAMLRHQELMQDQAFERFKALLEAKTKIEVAEISAGATLDAAQISAANQGADDASV